MGSVRVRKARISRISQGDVYRDVQLIESVWERRGFIEVSRIVFPLVVVLTQDCDLLWDAASRRPASSEGPGEEKPPNQENEPNQDKRLFSVLVAPIYNVEHLYQGTHLDTLGLRLSTINKNKSPGRLLRQNQSPRYHYLEFPSDVAIVPSAVDFKHYFSVTVHVLDQSRPSSFVCRLSPLDRADLSHRFATYLARIALPDGNAGSPQG